MRSLLLAAVPVRVPAWVVFRLPTCGQGLGHLMSHMPTSESHQ